MKLRKKAKYEMESYSKMLDLRKESVAVLKILMSVWQREEVKKRINLCEQKTYEITYENFLREKNITPP